MKIARIDSISEIETFTVSLDKIRVTDPCYDMETWCAGTLENVKPGTWEAHVGYHKDALDTEWGEKRLAEQQERINQMSEKPEADGDDFWKHYAKTEQMRLDKDRAAFEARLGRVAYLHIVHSEDNAHFDHKSELDSTWVDSGIDVGVDSGQAGFFDEFLFDGLCHDKALKDAFYSQICDLTCERDASWGSHITGVVSSTGWGDGSYTCLVRRNDHGQAIEAVILYLTEEEDEDDEEDTSEAVEGNSHD